MKSKQSKNWPKNINPKQGDLSDRKIQQMRFNSREIEDPPQKTNHGTT